MGTLCHLFITFKLFVDKLLIKRPHSTTVEKKTLFLSLPELRGISFQTRTKLRKSLKGLLNSCKRQIFLKAKGNFQMLFNLKIAYFSI